MPVNWQPVKALTLLRSQCLPTPSVSSSYDNDEDSFVSEASLYQPLWTGGKLTANVNTAIFDDKAAVEHIHEQQNAIAQSTIEAWKGYIQAIAEQDIHIETLTQLSDFEAFNATPGQSRRFCPYRARLSNQPNPTRTKLL